MFETTNALVNKLFLRIDRGSESPSSQSAMDLTLEFLYEQTSAFFQFATGWEPFRLGGPFATEGGFAGGFATSFHDADSQLWAASIHVRDDEIPRRRWNYHIGIRQIDADSIRLYYAKCCYDHLAGSIYPPRPVPTANDRFIEPLFFDPRLQCMCGSFPYAAAPVRLDEDSLPEFVRLIEDEERLLPALLVTCPDVIVPEELSDALLGNAVVYWTLDAEIVRRLNSILPEELFTPWDSVRVFMPMQSSNAYHPVFPYETIHRMGESAFVSGLRQAYCASMRSEDRRHFPTPDDLSRLRDRARINALTAQTEELRQSIQRAAQQNEILTRQLAEQRDLSASATSKSESEYESLLSELMKENDSLKAGISNLSAQLYSNMGIGFQPNPEESIASLKELAHAIQASLACVSSRKSFR